MDDDVVVISDDDDDDAVVEMTTKTKAKSTTTATTTSAHFNQSAAPAAAAANKLSQQQQQQQPQKKKKKLIQEDSEEEKEEPGHATGALAAAKKKKRSLRVADSDDEDFSDTDTDDDEADSDSEGSASSSSDSDARQAKLSKKKKQSQPTTGAKKPRVVTSRAGTKISYTSRTEDGEDAVIPRTKKEAAAAKKEARDQKTFRVFSGNATNPIRMVPADDPVALKYSKMTIDRLKDFLRANNQTTSGKKEELVEKCLDGELNGSIEKCPRCSKGKVRFDPEIGMHVCPGYFDDDANMFLKCKFAEPVASRGKWVDAESAEATSAPASSADPTTTLSSSAPAAVSPEFLASMAGVSDPKEVATKVAEYCRGVLHLALPEDEKQARLKVGPVIMSNRGEGGAFDYAAIFASLASTIPAKKRAEGAGGPGQPKGFPPELAQELVGLGGKEVSGKIAEYARNVLKLSLPQDDKQALLKVGPIVMSHRTSTEGAEAITSFDLPAIFRAVIAAFPSSVAAGSAGSTGSAGATGAATARVPANEAIAAVLDEVAGYEKKKGGENVGFKIAGLKKAAIAVRSLSFEITEGTPLGKPGSKTKVENIGKSTAAYIQEFLDTGKLARLEELKAEFP